ncbi:MAG: hypothetical protein HY925_15650 [Elusimicrobia bacterium]|nr:hypothetical protein [Elusimicrobiota bacterium]
MRFAGLILFACAGASFAQQTKGAPVPIVPLAASEVAIAGTAARPLPAASFAALSLQNPLAAQIPLAGTVRAVTPTANAVSRAILGRMGESLAGSLHAGRAASAEPIAQAMDGSAERKPLADQTPVESPLPSAPSRFQLSPASNDETPAAPEPPAPKPWKAKAKKGATIGAGWILLVLGALLWVLPIPGPTGIMLGGLALLSRHYVWAAAAQARLIALTLAMTAWFLARLKRSKS